MSIVKSAGGLIVFRVLSASNLEYLLLKASYGDHHWSFPKGHTDPRETNFDAAWRETREETGLIPAMLTHIQGWTMSSSYPVGNHTKFVEYWLARLNNPEQPITIDPHESEEYVWVNHEKAKVLLVYESTISILNSAHSFLLQNGFGKQ